MTDLSFVYIIRHKDKAETPDQEVVTELTSRYHDIIELSIEQAAGFDFSNAIMLIVDVPPDNYETVTSLKKILQVTNQKSIPSFFVLGSMTRKETMQVQILGASDFLVHPVNHENFITKLGKLANNSIEDSWKALSKTQEAALKAGLKVFEDLFANVKEGQAFSNEDIRQCCDLTIKATAGDGLSDMISAIRTHHNYTYRHSMMVSGYLSAFGLLLGIKGNDMQNLVACGLIHDIGKAYVSPDLLDKPGPLTDEEWVEMKKHPEYSRQILESIECNEIIFEGCIHHHEKLDGTGYPDGLKGDEVSDIARMVAIADVFSGVTEKRSYKKSMSKEKAYDIMLSMQGHLDMDLVNAFKPIALDILPTGLNSGNKLKAVS